MYVLYANVHCTMRSTQYILAREYRILQQVYSLNLDIHIMHTVLLTCMHLSTVCRRCQHCACSLLVRFRLMNVIIVIVALKTKALSLPTGAYN